MRVLALIGIGKSFGDALATRIKDEKDGLTPSCISCENFDEPSEICKVYKARPPARVIALSCKSYDDKDSIPF